MALSSKLRERNATVSVVGLGYVGLPLAAAFAQAGFRTIGIDVNEERIRQVQAGQSFIGDVPGEMLASLVRSRRLTATNEFGVLKDVDTVSICVPTPLGKTKDPDLSSVISAVDAIAAFAHPDQLIVLESTVYPGTTEEILLPRLSLGDLVVGQDLFVAYSPERIDPGNRHFTLRNTPKVISGITPRCLEVATLLYGTVSDRVIPVSSPRAAEMVKLLENTFRAVNIALVNEAALMCDRLGLDVWEIVDAAATKPFGFMPFYPGPGLGGHCLPVDPHYLSWKLRVLNYRARFIQLADEINGAMPEHVLGKIADALNDDRKSLKGARVLLLGIAYKRDVADTRESPALDLVRLLQGKGAEVSFHDPHVPALAVDGSLIRSVPLDESLEQADCVVIVADHTTYDWTRIVQRSRLIVDTRNATKGIAGQPGRIVKL
jgi:UDP-N-acetyl-D-glucosamine dehydrogenase